MPDPISVQGFPVADENVGGGYAQVGPARGGGPPERALTGDLVRPWAQPPGRAPGPLCQPVITNACSVASDWAASLTDSLYVGEPVGPDGIQPYGRGGAPPFARYPRRRRPPVYQDPPHCCRECD